MTRKLPFPEKLFNATATAVIEQEGISETGAPLETVQVSAKCIYQEHTYLVITDNGRKVISSAKVIFKGDIAPGLKTVSQGTVTINEKTYDISVGHRIMNPDGSVFETELELK